MKIAYFGTPEISARLLETLLASNLPISYVITQPDKPSGKRLQITASPVKTICQRYAIDFFDSSLSKSTTFELVNILRERKIELCILFAYGQLISAELLSCTRYGFWNIHPSLLPYFRGASPTVYPILLGERSTGVTLMQMNEKLDEGDILDQCSFEIHNEMMRQDIEQKSIEIAAHQITAGIADIESHKPHHQNSSLATYTRKITKSDGFIESSYIQHALRGTVDISTLPKIYTDYYQDNNLIASNSTIPAVIIHQMFRALSPWPGIWTKIVINGIEKRLKIIALHRNGSQLVVDQVQLEGKAETDFDTFQRAYNIF